MVLASRGSTATLGIAARAEQLVDETGAGDVVAAAVSLALAAGADRARPPGSERRRAVKSGSSAPRR